MRGRQAGEIDDRPAGCRMALLAAAHSDSLPWSQVRRAKIVLAIAAGEHQSSVAARLECDESHRLADLSAVSPGWPGRLVRRWAARQLGPPAADFPGATGPDRRTGLLGADRQGVAHHALVQRGPGPPGGGGQDRPRDQPGHGSPHLARRRFATPSDSVLEDAPGWTPGSRSGRSKSFGAMGMRPGWLSRASGWCASMRSRPSRSWSGTRSAGRSPARSSNRSSTIPGMGR